MTDVPDNVQPIDDKQKAEELKDITLPDYPKGKSPEGYVPLLDQQSFVPGAIKQRHLVPQPTQPGDLYFGKDGNSFDRVSIGTSGQALVVAAGVPTWTSNVAAGSLLSATTTINVSSATAPTTGQILTATSSTTATWQAASGSNDGWISTSASWSYASATTITVPSGAASLYSVGDKIKFTQTTVKYFYIVDVADTVLTVTGGTDYTVANAAISAISYSHQDTPVGFPVWFAYTPSFTGFSSGPASITGAFTINGRLCTLKVETGNGTSNSTGFTLSLPVTGVTSAALWGGYGTDNGTLTQFGLVYLSSSTILTLQKTFPTDGSWTNSGNKAVPFLMASYRI